MPVWQSIYEELKDKNFEIISAAQDTGGEEAAGKIFDAAGVKHTALIDVHHTISTLFNFVNVPAAVWIDEEGRIVRHDEGTYAKQHKLGTMEFGIDTYVPALRDWIEKGSESVYALKPEQMADKLVARTSAEALAEPTFKLGVYFHFAGDEERANKYWEQSQELNPDSWNFHRQDWSFTPREAGSNWMAKFQALGDKPYYAPIDLPAPAGD